MEFKTAKEYIRANPKPAGLSVSEYAREAAEKIGLSAQTIRTKFYKLPKEEREISEDPDRIQYGEAPILTDKKISDITWREAIDLIQARQAFKQKFKGSQDFATWEIQAEEPIHILILGDLQIGCLGVDYEAFLELTDFIMDTPNLYVLLVGDILQMAVNKRSISEILSGSGLDPEEQLFLAEDWLKEIKSKVIASTWDNHTDMRMEKLVGYSQLAAIYKRHVIYFSGIGHLDIKVNDLTYKLAVSHRFRGRSYLHNAHAPLRYLREKYNEGDIAIQGDYHTPGIEDQQYGGKDVIGIVCGSIQGNSGYIKRHYSLKTFPYMPIITLHHREKFIIPYKCYRRWIARTE